MYVWDALMYTQHSVAQSFQVYADAQSTTLISYQQGLSSPRPVIAAHRVRVLLAFDAVRRAACQSTWPAQGHEARLAIGLDVNSWSAMT
jgi:hypothetical protein